MKDLKRSTQWNFLTQEDEGPQENYELEFLGAEEPMTLEIDTMDILEQLEEMTGPPTVHIRKTNISMELAAKENLEKQEKLLKEQVPQELHDYLSVFDKKTAERFPKSRPWDDCQGTSLAVCTPLYTLFTVHISPSFYFAYIHLLLFGYHLNLSCSQ